MLSELARVTRPAIVVFVVLSAVTGIVYPLAVTGLATVLFPGPAAGSLIVQDGKTVGSRLVGQPFTDPKYFWSRPSATGPTAYNAGASSGSNLGPLNSALESAVKDRVAALKSANSTQPARPPVDLVTASGSGLDPHISPAAAYYQVSRVAAARGLSADQVRQLVERHVEPRTLGVLGEPRVNVLLLNLELEQKSQEPKSQRSK